VVCIANQTFRATSPSTYEVEDVGRYRVFYEVEEETSTVAVGAVGFKVHGVLYIRGEEVKL